MRTDIAEALDHRGGGGEGDAELVERAAGEEGDAVAGGLGAAGGTLEDERLAGDDARHQPAGVGRVGVHHPRHGLLVGPHVGRHHIDVRADEGDHFHRVAAGHPFQLAGAHRPRVAGDAALAAAIREVHQRALPVHPHRQRGDLAEIDARVVAQAAFHRAAGQVMLDAVAEIDLGRAVVVADRDGDGDQALGPFAALAEGLVEAEEIRHAIELGGGHGKDRVSQEFIAHGSFLTEDRGMPTLLR